METIKRQSRHRIVAIFLAVNSLLVGFHCANAQQPTKVARIGFLELGYPPPRSVPLERLKPFHEGLRELGYIEGKNLLIEYRYAKRQREHLLESANEFVRLKVKAIIAPSTPAIRAAKEATSTTPIVMLSAADPVGMYVDSLARPGGNMTGVSGVASELSGKLLELITEAVPSANRVGVLWNPITSADSLKETEIAARALKRQLQIVEVRSHNDLEKAMQGLGDKRVRGLVVLPAVSFSRNARRIAHLAVERRIATIFWRSRFADDGGLLAYGPDPADQWRRAGVLAGKILNGAKPADLPVERPMKFELVINLKTATQLGLKIPQSMLYRADRVIK